MFRVRRQQPERSMSPDRITQGPRWQREIFNQDHLRWLINNEISTFYWICGRSQVNNGGSIAGIPHGAAIRERRSRA